MTSKYVYPAVFTPEEKGMYSVRFPDVDGCYTCGNDLPDAISMAEDALAIMLYEYESEGKAIPKHSNIEDVKHAPDEIVSYVMADTMRYRKRFNNKAMKKSYFYPAVFTYEEGQEIAVVFPDLDAATSGVDDDDAFMSARECLGITLFGLEEDKEDIPAPSPLESVKTAPNERAVLVDVYMPSIRMANNNKAVTRTITLPAWLNARAQENGINFSQVMQEALKEKLGA